MEIEEVISKVDGIVLREGTRSQVISGDEGKELAAQIADYHYREGFSDARTKSTTPLVIGLISGLLIGGYTGARIVLDKYASQNTTIPQVEQR